MRLLLLTLLRAGGFNACMAPFMAEQYLQKTESLETGENGGRVIIDPKLTIQTIFRVNFW